ncbi:MAG: hypothetical protein EXR72_14100 [Myxococcales bacterium]|nr:hypothetical protein [Myxococcales bacterium]
MRATRPFRGAEGAALDRLTSVDRIQAFLDETSYSAEAIYRAPVRVLRDRRAHCVDGALLAACALERLGHPPLLVDLRAVRDDDHVIAVFHRRGRIGAVAKSNTVNLRFREPVYRDLRELVMSYFDLYFNTNGEKTLRSYASPLDLRRFDALAWRTRDEAAAEIVRRLDSARHYPLVSRGMIPLLRRIDDRSYRAGLLGADAAGLFAGDRVKCPLQ